MNYQKEKGQVLVIGIIMLLAMLMAIFIFFDVHNVIRAKIKLESAEQAAALAAARWQGESLNLIGEINLLIASENVLNDSALAVPNRNASLRQQAAYRVKSLNEMQSRISFLGPLIAFSAAQQAAKNNGVSSKSGTNSPSDDFAIYSAKVNTDPRYQNFSNVNGFVWKEPYLSTLQNIISAGLAVRPSARITGIENVNPAFLVDESLYKAIIACEQGINAWCHITLRELIKNPDADNFFRYNPDLDIQWFTPDFNYVNFPKQSEIYGVDVMLKETYMLPEIYRAFIIEAQKIEDVSPVAVSGSVAYDDDVLTHDLCRFYIYKNNWYPGNYSYTGPETGGDSPWQGGYFLRDDLKDEAIYGGPIAYAESYQNVSSVLNFRAKNQFSGKSNNQQVITNPGGGSNSGFTHYPAPPSSFPSGSGKAPSKAFNTKTFVENQPVQVNQVGGNFGTDAQYSGAVAKVYGSFSNPVRSPVAIPAVMPIFHKVSIIPSTMENYRVFGLSWRLVERFVAWLASVENLDDEKADQKLTPPAGSEYMLEALRLLATEEFRKKGYNPDFKSSTLRTLDYAVLFDKSYAYPANPYGAGWLQMACIRRDWNPPEFAARNPDKYYVYNQAETDRLNQGVTDPKKQSYPPPNGESWVYHGNEYLVIQSDGTILNNENDPYMGCGRLSGGGPGRIPPGSNTGPSRL